MDASVIGATRALGVAPPRPQPQDVSVEAQRSGTYCVGPADTVWLVRATAGPGSLTLRRRGSERSLAWPQGAARAEWPSDLPIEDGDSFEVLADGHATSMLTFRTVAATSPSDPAAIAEGVLLGCHEQHEAALRRLARSAVPPELWLTTERGRAPAYRAGEPITLTAIAAAEGWLYCVAQRADGTAAPLFPAGAADSARIPASVPTAIPGPRRGAALQAGRPGYSTRMLSDARAIRLPRTPANTASRSLTTGSGSRAPAGPSSACGNSGPMSRSASQQRTCSVPGRPACSAAPRLGPGIAVGTEAGMRALSAAPAGNSGAAVPSARCATQ